MSGGVASAIPDPMPIGNTICLSGLAFERQTPTPGHGPVAWSRFNLPNDVPGANGRLLGRAVFPAAAPAGGGCNAVVLALCE